MKSKPIVGLLISFVTVLFLMCASQKVESDNNSHDLDTAILHIYGQAIYEREKCNTCHTLQVDKSSNKIISLDGLGNKFDYTWLHHYLLNPSDMIPNTKKTSYSHLHEQSFDTVFLNYVSHMYKTGQTDKHLMTKLINESKTVTHDLKKFGIVCEQKEILALIAYLNQIPASPEKMRRDSLQTAEWNRNRALIDSLKMASYFEEIDTNEMETVIEKGQQIFQNNCQACHGQNGQGIVGPNLTDDFFLNGGSRKDITGVIIDGVEGKGMVPWKNALNPKDIRAVSAFVYSIKGTNAPFGKSPQGVEETSDT